MGATGNENIVIPPELPFVGDCLPLRAPAAEVWKRHIYVRQEAVGGSRCGESHRLNNSQYLLRTSCMPGAILVLLKQTYLTLRTTLWCSYHFQLRKQVRVQLNVAEELAKREEPLGRDMVLMMGLKPSPEQAPFLLCSTISVIQALLCPFLLLLLLTFNWSLLSVSASWHYCRVVKNAALKIWLPGLPLPCTNCVNSANI